MSASSAIPAVSAGAPLRRLGRCVLACMALVALPVGASAQQGAHREAIEQARRGEHASALATLRRLVAESPQDAALLHDYAAVLNWAERHDEVIALADRIERAAAPTYVLQALAGSHYRGGQPGRAATFYELVLDRDPGNFAARVGLMRSLLGADRVPEANALVERSPQSAERWFAEALLLEHRGDHVAAIALYDRVSAARPDLREARTARIQAIARSGAADRALALALAEPGLLSTDELEAVRADKIAIEIRQAITTADVIAHKDRFGGLDAALAQTDELARRATQSDRVLSKAERRMLADRVVGLAARHRMHEAVELFDALSARGEVPAYVKAAAASAHLYRENAARGRQLLEQAIAAGDTSTQTAMALFYAQVETEDYRAAAAHIATLAAQQPRLRNAQVAGAAQPNPEYLSSRVAQANLRSWSNRPWLAQAQLDELATQAPRNGEVQAALGGVYWARGWPQRSAQALGDALLLDPDNAMVRAERVGPLLERYRYREAEAEIARANEQRPESKRVQRNALGWHTHNRPQLTLESTRGTSRGNAPTGVRDLAIESYAYSAPLAYSYRPYVHGYHAEARYPNTTAQWQRLGAGLEYRHEALRLAGEVNAGLNDGDKAGAAANGEWRADDHWVLGGSVEAQTNAIPLQAVAAGRTADRYALETEYRFHESRSIAAGTGLLKFSDGNARTTWSLAWQERLHASPRLKLDARIGLYGSRNSLSNAPYFNPSADFSPEFTLHLQWLTWRDYSRALTQRLRGSAGRYAQSGFAAGPVWELYYGHAWELGPRFSLQYGVGRVLHPYDGNQTGRTYYSLGVDWRF